MRSAHRQSGGVSLSARLDACELTTVAAVCTATTGTLTHSMYFSLCPCKEGRGIFWVGNCKCTRHISDVAGVSMVPGGQPFLHLVVALRFARTCTGR